jgi:hypothetical protein
MRVVVPPNVTAKVIVPTSGGEIKSSPKLVAVKNEYNVGSGEYSFEAPYRR